MQLVAPSSLYKQSFLEALDEYHKDRANDRMDILSLDPDVLAKDFETYVQEVREESVGKHLPKGYVPQTTYWLIASKEFIGRVSIRHQLTPFLRKIGGHIGYDIRPSKRRLGYGATILKLALPKAKALGIENVLITCDETNVGSRKIIEKNGGVLEDSVPQQKGLPNKLRFWITL